jgi:hypothetical protein
MSVLIKTTEAINMMKSIKNPSKNTCKELKEMLTFYDKIDKEFHGFKQKKAP